MIGALIVLCEGKALALLFVSLSLSLFFFSLPGDFSAMKRERRLEIVV